MTTKTPIPFLDLKAQRTRIADGLRKRIDAVLAHCQVILGPEVQELETALAHFCGARHCVTVSSGTDALQIAMMAEGIGPGDAVFLPAFTYTATAEVPLLLGATPAHAPGGPSRTSTSIGTLSTAAKALGANSIIHAVINAVAAGSLMTASSPSAHFRSVRRLTRPDEWSLAGH